MTEENITLTIKTSTWKKLNERKEAGESFDSVINRALNEIPAKKKESKQ